VQYSYDLTVNSFGKAFAYVRNCFVDEENVHMAQIKSWKNKNNEGFYTKTTQKGGFSKLCVKIKKRCYTVAEMRASLWLSRNFFFGPGGGGGEYMHWGVFAISAAQLYLPKLP
jgi:hypothetical protein